MSDEFNNQNNQNYQDGQYYQPSQDQQQQQYYQAPNQDNNQYGAYNGNVPPQGNNQYNGNMPPQGYYYNGNNVQPVEEKANVGLAILSFLIPIVGLVLYLTQKNDKPKTAKACGKCALASFIIYLIFCISSVVFSFVIAGKVVEDNANYPSYSDEYSDYNYDYDYDYDYGYDFGADNQTVENN